MPALTRETNRPRKTITRNIKALIARYDAEGRGCEFHIDHIRNIPDQLASVKDAAKHVADTWEKDAAKHVADTWESGNLAEAITKLLGLIETL